MSWRVRHPATSSSRTKPGKPGTSSRASNHASAGGYPRRISTMTSVSTRVTGSPVLAAPDTPPKLAGELHRVADVIPVRPRPHEPVGLQDLQHLPARLGLARARRRARWGGTRHRLLGLQLVDLLFD